MKTHRRAALRLVLLGALVWTSVAQAGEGRVELSHDGVLAGAGGYPFTLAQPGSYVLTSDLIVPDGVNGLEIEAHGVRIDLNGFAIRGAYVCDSGSCSPGTNVGIHAGLVGSDTAEFTSVVHGEVSGFGDDCLDLGPGARVEDLVVRSCGQTGVRAQQHSQILSNRITSCGLWGIHLNGAGTYAQNVISLVDLAGGAGGFVEGALGGGGNVCDVGRCPRERRRYYLTPGTFQGNHGGNVCGPGFHFASGLELADPSNLEYDTTLGQTGVDSGGGPPDSTGWVRSAANNTISANACIDSVSLQPWTSNNSMDAGMRIHPRSDVTWQFPAEALSPWGMDVTGCNQFHPVWCIED